MAASTFTPPPNLTFNLGTTESKIDMTLDDLVKASKAGKKVLRVGAKNSNKVVPNATVRRAALQKAVAARSSNIRQGKLAEVRSKNAKAGATLFPRARAQGKRALATPVTATDKQFARQAGAVAAGTGSMSKTARRNAKRRLAKTGAAANAGGGFQVGGNAGGILGRLGWPAPNGNGVQNGNRAQNGNRGRAQNGNGASGAAGGPGGRLKVTIINERATGGKRAK